MSVELAQPSLQVFEKLAHTALGSWGIEGCIPELIKHRENAVFRARSPGGEPAVLRVHRYGYHNDAELLSELQWMHMLDAGGLHIPQPIPARDGGLFVHADVDGDPREFQVDLLTWLEGERLGDIGSPLTWTGKESQRIFFQLGEEAARLHELSDAWDAPAEFTRHAWDLDGLLGSQPFWGRFWDVPALNGTQRDLLQEGRAAARTHLETYAASGGSYGLIHADLIPENVLVTPDSVRIIDFDDGGFGWRMFEIATVLYKNAADSGYPQIQRAFLDGYCKHRLLTDADLGALELFTLLRSYTYIGWCHARLGIENNAQLFPNYIEDACALTEQYLRRAVHVC